MTTQERTLAWGYNAAVPQDAKAAWGARLILTGNSAITGGDLLHDRQSGWGDKEWRDVLAERLNRVQPWKQKLATLVYDGRVRMDGDNEVVVYEDAIIKVVGNANASYGYFYMAAWVK